MNTQITTIGAAMLLQHAIRYGAFIAMTWLVLTFVDGWIMTWIAQ